MVTEVEHMKEAAPTVQQKHSTLQERENGKYRVCGLPNSREKVTKGKASSEKGIENGGPNCKDPKVAK